MEDIMRFNKKEHSKENNINKQDLTLIKYKISKETDGFYWYSLIAVTFHGGLRLKRPLIREDLNVIQTSVPGD